jgi:hypothetical protein
MTITPSLPSTISPRHTIAFGGVEDCGEEMLHQIHPTNGRGIINSHLDVKVDDRNAPDHFLVNVTYGLHYKEEGWSYNKYQLRLQADVNGDLQAEMVEGHDGNLFSADLRAQAGTYIQCSNTFRLNIFCRAIYHHENQALANEKRVSLCLKTD